MRKFVFFLLFLVVIAGAATIYFGSQLGDVARNQIEVQGSAATGTTVTVDDVNLSGLLQGNVELSSLTVTNPNGYTDGPAVFLNGLSIGVDPASLLNTDEPLGINHITIKQPVIAFESGRGSSNLKTIESNIKRYIGSGSGATHEGRKIKIDKVLIEGGRLAITHPALGKAALKTDLPPIEVNNIGQNGGVTPAQATATVLDAILDTAIDVSLQAIAEERLPIDISPGGVLDKLKGIGK